MDNSLGVYDISLSIIAIMITVSGILIGLGYATDDKKLKEFGRTELLQSLINGAILGLLLAGFSSGGFFTILINTIVNSSTIAASCPAFMHVNYAICFAYDYLVGLTPVRINGTTYPSLMDMSLPLLVALSVAYTGLGLVGSLKLSIGVLSIGLASALTPLLSQLNYLINAITLAIVSIEAQAILLQFVAATAIPVLLPIGMMLRTLYITRRLGGAVIAIAIGLFCVFPLTYMLNAELTSSYFEGSGNYTLSSVISSLGQMKGSASESVLSLNNTKNNTSSGILSSITNALGGIVSNAEGLFEELARIVAFLIVEIFFLPAFSLILTAISIREFAHVLGSEMTFGKFHVY